MCKTIVGGSLNTYNVTTLFTKPANWVVTDYNLYDYRPAKVGDTTEAVRSGSKFYDNVVAEETISSYGSYKDFVAASIEGLRGTGVVTPDVNPASLDNCGSGSTTN
jgi:hypothetical protein